MPVNEEIERVKELMHKGYYREALKNIERLEEMELANEDRLTSQVVKSDIFLKKGNYLESLNLAHNVLHESKRHGYQLHVIDANITIAEGLWRIGKHKKSIDTIEQGEQLLKTLVGVQPSEYAQREAILLNLKGTFYLNKGDLDHALQYYQQSLMLGEKIGNKYDIAKSLHNIGCIFEQKGELSQAIEYQEKSLAFFKKIGSKQGIAWAFDGISLIHQRRGDLDRAIELCQKGLRLREELGNKHDIAHSIQNIGIIYKQKGEIDRAWTYLKRSQALFDKIGNDACTAFNLFYLVSMSIDRGSSEVTQQYLQHLQQINKREENKVINQQYRIAKALVLKTSPRARKRGKAEELLEQVAEEEIVSHELTVLAMLNLCDLLILELRTIEDKEVLDEVKIWIKKLLELAETQPSYSLLVETYLLQSKLVLLELDLHGSQQLLARAQQIANEKGLRRLSMIISLEQESLLSQLNKWEKIIDQKPSMRAIIEVTQVEDLLERIINKRLYRKEEEIREYATRAQQLVEKWKKA